MANVEKANRAAEVFAERTAGSYKAVVDHAVGLQERNLRFFRGVVEDFAGEVRQQAEANRALVEEFVERAEKQRDAFQTVVEESLDAYWDLAFAPFSYYREGIEQVGQQVVARVSDITTGLPIANYDELNVGEVVEKLEDLSVEDLKKVRAYEKGNKNRDTLVEQIDRKIKAAS